MKYVQRLFLRIVFCGFAGITGLQAIAQNNQWTWMKGSNTLNQVGTYGTQGIAASGNSPGARAGSITWSDGSGNLWLFGGDGYAADGTRGNLNDLWKYDITTGNWAWIKGSNAANQAGTYGTQGVANAGNTPGARQLGVSWTDDNGNFWLFGGSGYSTGNSRGYLNDLWKYDIATNNWTWVKGGNTTNQPGTYGTQGIAATNNTPGTRQMSVSWKDASGNLWLFGGLGYAATYYSDMLNDLWKYDRISGNWSWMKGSTGFNQSGIYGTQGIPANANRPGARMSAVSWTDTSGNLCLFGGFGYATASNITDYMNDLWKYDPTTGYWTWIKGSAVAGQAGTYGTQGSAAPSNVPGARAGSVAWKSNNGNLWLFGGDGYIADGTRATLSDLWRYDAAAANWVWMKGSNTANQSGNYGVQGVAAITNAPGARGYGVSWTGATGSDLWLFGAIGLAIGNSQGALNDLWSYKYCNAFNLPTPASGQTLAASQINLLAAGSQTNFETNCLLSGIITSNGNNPVSGSATAKVWVEASEPFTTNAIYIRRHAEVIPTTDATTATGKVTLYALQSEFTNYNNISTAALPTGPTDAAGISRLRIYKYSGTSSDGTGLPTTYNGTPTVIDPTDADITWNGTGNYWQISFDIMGFSGFFVGAAIPVLPIKLATFTATKQAGTSLLTWNVAQEDNIATYTIERSSDGRKFTIVGSVASLGNTTAARSYSFTDASPIKGADYYRLKIIEKDSKVSYSEIRLLNWGSQISIALYPNPAKDKATLTGVEAGMTIRLLDAVGKVLQVQIATCTTESLLLSGLSKGFYEVQVYGNDGNLLSTARLVKE